MKALFAGILCLFIMVSLSSAQEAKWIKVPQISQQTNKSLRSEVLSRLPQQYRTSTSDSIGFGHYNAGHYMNSYLRNKYGSGFSTCAVYVYGGHAFICPQPREFTLSEVARRDGGYFPGGAADPIGSWNSQPFYVFDELVAYTHGTICGLQGDGGHSGHTLSGSYTNMKHLLRLSKTAVKLAYERGYPYAREADGFVRHMEKVQQVCIEPYIVRR